MDGVLGAGVDGAGAGVGVDGVEYPPPVAGVVVVDGVAGVVDGVIIGSRVSSSCWRTYYLIVSS